MNNTIIKIVYENGTAIDFRSNLDIATVKANIGEATQEERPCWFLEANPRSQIENAKEIQVCIMPHKAILVTIVALSDLTLIN